MTARAINRLVDTLRAQGKSVKDAGTDRYMAQCPAHDDTEPSLSIALRRNGDGALIKCHAGCEPSDIVAALGWTVRDLFDEPRKRDAYRTRATYAWLTNCEVVPELPSLRGWVEAMISLGRLIFFDQPGTGASDPVTPGALPTLEQWADSITAVLDDLGSTEAFIVAADGAFATAAMFAGTHPSRTTALVALGGYAADPTDRDPEETKAAMVAMWGRASICMQRIRTCRRTRRSGQQLHDGNAERQSRNYRERTDNDLVSGFAVRATRLAPMPCDAPVITTTLPLATSTRT